MVINKKRSILIVIFLMVALCLGSTVNTYAATKTKVATGYKAFSGSMESVGIIVAWGVNFKVAGTYETANAQYTLKTVDSTAYIQPKRVDEIGNGTVNATAFQTVDYGNTTSSSVYPSSSAWKRVDEIWSTDTYPYFLRQATPNKTFMYSYVMETKYSFYHPKAVIYSSDASLELSISGPK